MGASSWIYYVPYQQNLEQAFQALRRRVFETDDYSHWWEGEWVVDSAGEEMDISRMQEVIEQEDGSLVPVPPLVFSRTLEEQMAEAVRRSGSQGTHSILDIRSLITDSSYYGALLLPKVILQQFFTGRRPTRAVVEALVFHEEIWAWVERWLKVGGRFIYGISKDIDRFFAIERSKQELTEALLAEETIWMNLHQLIAAQIEHLAMRTRFGRAMPLSSEDLIRFFGNEKPTRADVEAAFAQREIWGQMRVGVGYYAVIYQDGVPQEIVFAGFSGD